MATSYYTRVLDAAVTALRGTTGYRAPGSPAAAVPVYDGPEVMLEETLPPGDFLAIGWSGTGDGPADAGSSQQVAVTVGTTRQRDETGRIGCLAVAQTGDSDYGTAKTLRDTALGYVAAVETAIHTDPWLGITGARNLVVEFAGLTSVQQIADGDGMACWLEFDITYTARL